MTKIKQIARKLDNGFYERVSLGATNISELVNDKGFITAADLPADAVVIPYAEQYYIRADETIEDVGEEYCRALMECFDENDNLIRDIYILVPSDNNNLLSLNSYQNKGTDSSGNNTKVLDFSILYDNDGVFFIVVQVTLITDANKENVVIMMEIKSQTGLQRKLTFDKVPTEGSNYNPVTSDGIKTYVDNAIPTNLSALTNDSGFITNTVSNLTNYYTKSETYTQDEVKALIDAVTTLNIEVVTKLPTENISATTIYLKGSETTGTNDYEEWIYANNDWELIGTTAVDLSGYLKTSGGTLGDTILSGQLMGGYYHTNVIDISNVVSLSSENAETNGGYAIIVDSLEGVSVADTRYNETVWDVDSYYMNLHNKKIVNVTNPTNAQDAATKNYVDTIIENNKEIITIPYSSSEMDFNTYYPTIQSCFDENNVMIKYLFLQDGDSVIPLSSYNIELTQAHFYFITFNENEKITYTLWVMDDVDLGNWIRTYKTSVALGGGDISLSDPLAYEAIV